MKRVCKLVPVIGLLSLLGACAFGESMTVYEALEPTAAQRASVLSDEQRATLMSQEQRLATESQLLAISAENKRRAQEAQTPTSDIEELKAIASQGSEAQ
ncbi:hypothetical protein [Pseudovibrio sp. SPO723]|uniref:hypothetical protein n=1 Tax=Nesiotobacter zosterae TaxID=392721 RepID=UPI0029C5DA30|nr:hypothetical protein [Pseudovibrio sp. SPO723]MDX5592627.1 hypothetical protein [Pseudovibrio sp. SPO723]